MHGSSSGGLPDPKAMASIQIRLQSSSKQGHSYRRYQLLVGEEPPILVFEERARVLISNPNVC